MILVYLLMMEIFIDGFTWLYLLKMVILQPFASTQGGAEGPDAPHRPPVGESQRGSERVMAKWNTRHINYMINIIYNS